MNRNVLLTGGPTHRFAETTPLLVALLAGEGIETTVVAEPSELFTSLRAAERGEREPIDLVTVHALRWDMAQERYAAQRDRWAYVAAPNDLAVVDRFVRHGGGLLVLHTAVICFDADPQWHALCGASWNWERSSHPPFGPVDVTVTPTGADHDITRGLERFRIDDEVYGFLDEIDDLCPLLTGNHGGRDHPLLWARALGAGRVVTDLLGHGPESFAHPDHRTLLARAARWLLGPVASANGATTEATEGGP